MDIAKFVEFRGPEEPVRMEEVEIPALKTGEILVKNEYTTLCRSDLNTFSGKRTEKTPTILGHEIVGRIAAFGPETKQADSRKQSLNIDDRITWAIYASDPDAELSREGIPQKAPDLFKYGHERITPESNLHGGLSEYTVLRANTPVAKLDEDVPLKLASIINCAVATSAGALRLAGELKGKNVLISGAGMLGITACAMCKIGGAHFVAALDLNPRRLETAREFGADAVFSSVQEMEREIPGSDLPSGFHAALDFSGVAPVMEETLKNLTIGGTAVWVGATHPQRNLQLNAEKVIRNLWTIKGLHNYNEEDFVTAVHFIENHHGDFPFELLVHDKFTLEKANEAFDYALKENPYRAGIRINHINK